MNAKKLLLSMLLTVCISTANCCAQPFDFFWSTHNLHEGAVNSDSVLDLAVGETASLFLYVSTHKYAGIDYAFIDVATSAAGIIEFTDAESFDFSINVGKIPIANRWLNNMGEGGSHGHTGIVTANLIDEWNAFTVNGGQGILRSNNGSGPFLDQGYDFGADAFLFGRIDFLAVGTGSIALATSPGEAQIFNGGIVVLPAVGDAAIDVTDGILLGDVNLDGTVNLEDVQPFVILLASGGFQEEADINQDGLFDSLDIFPFVELLSDL